MRRFVVLFMMVVLTICAFGCSKKQSAMEEGADSASLTSLPYENAAPGQPIGAEGQTSSVETGVTAGQTAAVTETKTEVPLPPSGPFKPTTQEIQTALKNAAFYTGEVDGKMGPKTRKAIEDFQAAHNLKADGKVGRQTWTVLQGYLNPAPAKEARKAKKR